MVWTRHKLENDLFSRLLKIAEGGRWKFENFSLSLSQGRTIKYLSDIKEMTMHICITRGYKRMFKNFNLCIIYFTQSPYGFKINTGNKRRMSVNSSLI